jgi:hypothetical protein
MTTSRTIPSQQLGTRLTEFIPIFRDGQIELYDIYYDSTWLGSGRTIEICRERVYFHRRKKDEIHSNV